ncbi:MAG: LysM peptidoglycan-binding domain-containing protein [Chloroflexi bacterium]|nr:MAG: LysM peptidoglycan-binding domain-containing protein [Chloroflexota bacterium]
MFVRTLQVCCLSLLVALFLAGASQPSQSLLQTQWTYRGGGPSFQTYVVQNGDTLVAIAARFGTDVNALMAANGLRTDHLSIGQVLRIPAAAAPVAQPVQPAPAKPAVAGPTYVVQNGDTLLAIAYRYGVDVNSLMSANGLPSADQLSIGQVLRIPGGLAPAAAVQPQPAQPVRRRAAGARWARRQARSRQRGGLWPVLRRL